MTKDGYEHEPFRFKLRKYYSLPGMKKSSWQVSGYRWAFFCTMQRRIVSCSFNRSKLELNNRNVERPFPVNIQTLIYNTAINFCARFLYFLSLCIFCILYIFISSYEFRCKCLAHLSFSLFPLFFSSVLYFLYLFHVFSS